MKLSGSAEAKRRQRRNDSGGGPEGVRDKVPNKSHSRTQSALQGMNLQFFLCLEKTDFRKRKDKKQKN